MAGNSTSSPSPLKKPGPSNPEFFPVTESFRGRLNLNLRAAAKFEWSFQIDHCLGLDILQLVQETCHILLVEDDPDDRLLFENSLKASKTPHVLETAQHVPEATAFLQSAQELPRMVVCDLWLGAENGLDLLRWMRAIPRFKMVPFVLIVTSISPSDLDEAYAAGANSCILKPSDLQAWNDTVRTLLMWWCHYALAPKTSKAITPPGWTGIPS